MKEVLAGKYKGKRVVPVETTLLAKVGQIRYFLILFPQEINLLLFENQRTYATVSALTFQLQPATVGH